MEGTCSLMVSSISRKTRRDALARHFEDVNIGGGPIEYILHPLGDDLTKAVIKFTDETTLLSILNQKHRIEGKHVNIAPLPQQVLGDCTANVEPTIMAGLPDLVACMDLLRNDFGVKVQYDSLAHKMTLTGSFLQIQFAQAALSAIFREQAERQRKALALATEKVVDIPISSEVFASRSLLSPLSYNSDSYCSGLESPPRTLKLEDLRAAPSASQPQVTKSNKNSLNKGSKTPTKQSVASALEASSSLKSASESKFKPYKSYSSVEVSSLPPEESHYLKDSRTVDDIFEGTKVATGLGPKSSEFSKTDQSFDSNMLSTWGTLGSSGKKVVVEFDTQVFNFMRRIHGQSLKDLERSYQVQLQYRKNGDITMVRVLPVDGGDEAVAATHQAKGPLINLYQTVFKNVVKVVVSLEKVPSNKKSKMVSVVASLKENYIKDIYIDTKDIKKQVTLVGPPKLVEVVEEKLYESLSLKKDKNIIKPKMVFFMQSQNAPGEVTKSQSMNGSNLEASLEGPTLQSSKILSPKQSEEFSQDLSESKPQETISYNETELGVTASMSHDSLGDAFPSVLLESQNLSSSRPFDQRPESRGSMKSATEVAASQEQSFTESGGIKVKPLHKMKSPRSSISPRPLDGDTFIKSQSTPQSPVPADSERFSVDGSHSLPGILNDPRAAWPTPEPSEGPTMKIAPVRESSKFSMGTSITGVTPLSSRNLSGSAQLVQESQDITEFSPRLTQSLHLNSLLDTQSFEQELKSSSTQRSSKSFRGISFMSTGEIQPSIGVSIPKSSYKFSTKEGIKISVSSGQITEAKVDVIVCPTGEDLHLLHGVAQSISEACGHQLQEECTQRVVNKGNLQVSECFAVSATGNLACQYVLCSACPMWCLYPEKVECEAILKKTLLGIFEYADKKLKAKSIALPAVGTGEHGVPTDVCGWALLAAVEELSSTIQTNMLKEIHIINSDKNITNVIGETLEEVLMERQSNQVTPCLSPASSRRSSGVQPDVPFIVSLLAACVTIAEKAGTIIRDIMKSGELGIVDKGGVNDLQTEADRSAEQSIVASLQAQFPGLAIVGEEGTNSQIINVKPEWLEMNKSADVIDQCMTRVDVIPEINVQDVVVWVDPLDGTSEYTQGLVEHVTTLIGIGVHGKSTAGVIYQPFYQQTSSDPAQIGRCVWGMLGIGSFGYQVQDTPEGEGNNVIVTTRSHGSGAVADAVNACEPSDVIKAGGCGNKVLMVLEGKAHAYVFASPGCKKWDTAAPEAVLEAAGGKLTDIHGNRLHYEVDVQTRNSAGVLATPADANHQWYIDHVPVDVKESLPEIMEQSHLMDPKHKVQETGLPSITGTKMSLNEVEDSRGQIDEHDGIPFLVKLLAACVSIAGKSGTIIRDIMKSGELGIVDKGGVNNLQTEADRSAEQCIVASLQAQFPGIAIVGEEGTNAQIVDIKPEWLEMNKSGDVIAECMDNLDDIPDINVQDVVVWVDPLDGTSEYTQGLVEHVTTLIGIGVHGKSTAGVIYQPFYQQTSSDPAQVGRCVWGMLGIGSFGYQVQDTPEGEGNNVIVTTRSHGSGAVADAVNACEPSDVIKAGGCGNKVLMVLEGKAHAYVFASPGCKKWDTAAPEAVLEAAGGKLTDIHGNRLHYEVDVQTRNSAGVLATPADANHQWYIDHVPADVKESLPEVMEQSHLMDPKHKVQTDNVDSSTPVSKGVSRL